jgi:HAMP domain-containing protein
VFGIKRFSIKSKLQIMLLIVSLISLLTIGYLSLSKANKLFNEQTFGHVNSVRYSKGKQVEGYFNNLTKQVEGLCQEQDVIEAMNQFKQGYNELQKQTISVSQDQAIDKYYKSQFAPRLAKSIEGNLVVNSYYPTSNPARYLQYYYIANSTEPVEKRSDMLRSNEKSNYGKAYNLYQKKFRDIIKRFDYSDLFLIDPDSGDVVYSVAKKTDFASNLFTGPYNNTNLAQVFKDIRSKKVQGVVELTDFSFYPASYNSPAAFIAGSIYQGNKRIGILAVRISVNQINQILANKTNWIEDGLGSSGETFIVGDDLRPRSANRFFLENPAGFLKILRQNRVRPSVIDAIARNQTTLLLQPIETENARRSLQGESGTEIVKSYKGSDVISAYAPLNVAGVNWGIVSEMDLFEANAPLRSLLGFLLLCGIILVALLSLFSTIASERFIRPIKTLLNQLNRSESGDLASQIEVKSLDETGELAKKFNHLIRQVHQKNEIIKSKEQENETLLVNIMPKTVIDRWRKGDEHIIEQFQQVTVLVIEIGNLKQDNFSWIEGYKDLITMIDNRAEKAEIERLSCFNGVYIAACGLTKARMDHHRRTVEFAQDVLKFSKDTLKKHHLNFTLKIGIHTGSVTTALVGEKKLSYDLYGEPIYYAHRLAHLAQANTILVTNEVYEFVQDLFKFEPYKPINLENGEPSINSWILGKSGLSSLISDLTFGLDLDDEDYFSPKGE